ncbi:hypothetical protein WJ58_26170 [Burkholderia ubonensis]|nr:hypothetical protein WJ58_26170 [Burkholderia ubonensis]
METPDLRLAIACDGFLQPRLGLFKSDTRSFILGLDLIHRESRRYRASLFSFPFFDDQLVLSFGKTGTRSIAGHFKLVHRRNNIRVHHFVISLVN